MKVALCMQLRKQIQGQARKRLAAWLLSALVCLPAAQFAKADSAQTQAGPGAAAIYVSPSGDDANEGSLVRPFRTLERAQLEARAFRGQGIPIEVNLRGGEYILYQPLRFSAQDSGSPGAPITWQAYAGEQVTLTGGIRLDASKAVPVTDEALLARVRDPQAAAALRCLDLSGYLPELPPLADPENPWDLNPNAPTLYIDGQPLFPARWPNDAPNAGYLRGSHAAVQGEEAQTSSFAFDFPDPENRSARWSAEAIRDLYVFGFLHYEWWDGLFKVNSLNSLDSPHSPDAPDAPGTAAHRVEVSGGFDDAPMEAPRFYFFNLLEEIDVPGECYLDRERSLLYFYPPENASSANDPEAMELRLSIQTEPLFQLQDTAYVTLRGLDFLYTRGNAVTARFCSHLTLEDCTIAHTSDNALTLDPVTESTVRGCEIYDTERGGIYLWDGDLRAQLRHSGNLIENNLFHHTSRVHACGPPALASLSCGVIIRHNEFRDLAHTALDIGSSNDALIEYNRFSRTTLKSADAGAIYYGRNPSIMGIQIRYNYFEDIGNTYGGYGQQSIFCDDGASMPAIYGNVFYNACDRTPEAGAAIKANGSQFGRVQGNVFIDVPLAALFGSWTNDWDARPFREDGWLLDVYGLSFSDHNMWARLTEEIDFFGETWREHYRGTQWEPVWQYLTPEGYAEAHRLADAGDEAGMLAFLRGQAPSRTNVFEGNVGVNIHSRSEGEIFQDNGAGRPNWVVDLPVLPSGAALFRDFDARDFTLTEEGLAAIRAEIPGFEALPFESMGRLGP